MFWEERGQRLGDLDGFVRERERLREVGENQMYLNQKGKREGIKKKLLVW